MIKTGANRKFGPLLNANKASLIHLLLCTFVTLHTLFGMGEDLLSQTRKNIPPPSKEHSFEGMVRNIRSFTIEENDLRYIGSEGKFLVRNDLSKKKDSMKPFSSSKKEPIEAIKISKMNLLNNYKKGHYLIFNGTDNEVFFYSPQNGLISRHSIPYDLIRPPSDRGGEAPEWEISDLRHKFKRNFTQQGYDKFTGMTPVPKKWMKASKDLYFVSSRIKDFPILILACNPVNPSQCSFFRACMVEGVNLNGALIAGITTLVNSRLILLGRKDTHGIDIFRYHSCLHITKRSSLGLPKQLKDLSNIVVDKKMRLWVSTLRPDDYFNASIFSWEKESWLPLTK